MPPSFIMIDDFVDNPHELRRQALDLGYDASAKDSGANYPGTVSTRALPIAGLDEEEAMVRHWLAASTGA